MIAAPPSPAAHSRAYLRYVLAVVLLVSAFNVADRTILSVLGQSIKAEFGLSDTRLGLLFSAFSVVHFAAGIPIARYADRAVRRDVIAAGLAVWSAMTAAAGLAQSFAQLLAARLGVGIGEAAGAPPSASLLSDYFPPERRARAQSMLSIGSIAGLGGGMLVGGWIAELHGWRAAFVAVGLPGIALALLVRFTVREPVRGASEGAQAAAGGESLLAASRSLASTPAFAWLVVGACVAGLASFGKPSWEPIFLIRVYGMGPKDAGRWFFLIGALPVVLGAWLGAHLTDRLAARDARWLVWLPGLCNAAFFPFAAAYLLWPEADRLQVGPISLPVAFVWAALSSALLGVFSPAIIAAAQSLARPHQRAFAHAAWTMLFNLIGSGLGSLLVGLLNERLTAAYGAQAIRWSLVWICAAAPASSVFLALSARTLRADIARARAG